MNTNNKIISNFLLVGTIAVLTGCAATQTAIEHGSLHVSTKQSETIFLDPVSNDQNGLCFSKKHIRCRDRFFPAVKNSLNLSWL